MGYTRIDHQSELIHFTRDNDDWDFQGSYEIFCRIIDDKKLISSTSKRLGDLPTICFTEAPYECLTENCELNKKYFNRYSPFGFIFGKNYIYNLGGLPVIYSPTHHFELNNPKTNWRTVSYDPIKKFGDFRDYTWEREWRIKPENNEIPLDEKNVKLVFPSREWANKFRNDHDQYHSDYECKCNCVRNATIIDFNRYFSKEEHETLVGTCPDSSQFPWILLNMNCIDIPSPK